MNCRYTQTKNEEEKLAITLPDLNDLFRLILRKMGKFRSFFKDIYMNKFYDWGFERFAKLSFSIERFVSLIEILISLIVSYIKSLVDSVFEFSDAQTSTGTTQNLAPRLLQSPF